MRINGREGTLKVKGTEFYVTPGDQSLYQHKKIRESLKIGIGVLYIKKICDNNLPLPFLT